MPLEIENKMTFTLCSDMQNSGTPKNKSLKLQKKWDLGEEIT